MRYVTIIISFEEEYIRSTADQEMLDDITDPREIWIDDTLVATQEAIHYVNRLDDGTAVGIARFRGDSDWTATLEDESPEIISCTVTGGETWLAYMHYEPDEIETALFDLIDTEAISIDWPMVETSDGLRITFFGEDAALQQVIAGFPDEVNLRLERAGEYQPGMDDPEAQLTDRQKEILRRAIAMGYYEIPRRTTQRELATELELSRGTIGEHLRRAEAKIIQSVIV